MADTGPIIAFARVGRLALLQQVVEKLAVPEAVYEDLVIKGQGRPGAAEVERATWIERRAISDPTMVENLPRDLHRGEREAIGLAQELRAQVLIDEKRGRRTAAQRGLQVLGSLGILAEAKRRGLIDRINPIVGEMLAVGYWIDEELLPAFLREIGEAPTQ